MRLTVLFLANNHGKPPMNSITSVSVDTDNIQAGYEAVKYLLKKGHQKI